MRTAAFVLATIAGVALPASTSAQSPLAFASGGGGKAGTPRNVVLIVADDLGRDLGCYGNTAIRTPSLDGLAKRGVRFTRAHATVASCSPSRASIYTGLFTHQSGQYGLQHLPHAQESHAWVWSLPRLLRAAGYFTGIIGKVHVGPTSVYPWEYENAKGGRNVAQMAQFAREFISKSGKRPFFLVMGYQDPHRAAKGFGNEPFAKDPAEVKYDPKKVIVPYHLPDQPEVREELAEYYQSVSRMDRGVGLILELLRETGHLDDTLIIFISDNGIPFPGAKTTLYAAGVHLPLIIAGPGLPQGHTNHGMASYIDLAPTILDWTKTPGPKDVAGKDVPKKAAKGYQLSGRSLLPGIGEENPKGWDAVFGSHQFHEITMYYPMRSIRTRDHSYILNLAHKLDYPFASDLWGSRSWQGILKRGDTMLGQRSVKDYIQRPREELYDLKKDPNELKNVAADPAYAEVLRDLRRRLRAWQEETNDPWVILFREEKTGKP
jgi:N-sulfoglucosamine sulfohydrolase